MKLTKPTLLVDIQKSRDNILFMKRKADQYGLSLRPHFKTHQSHSIGELFRDQNINQITVSSVDMARYFAKAGWSDILIAFPLNINEIEEINQLAKQVTLHLTIENLSALQALEKHLKHPVGIYLKIDAGYKRTGIHWENQEIIHSLVEKTHQISHLQLTGLLVHSGHTYHAQSTQHIKQIHDESIERLTKIRNSLPHEYNDIVISIGDTPGCTLAEDFEGVHEIRPGNFVFYDLQQYKAGVCSLSEIAVAMACPVVAKHEDRNELVIFGGAVHFSKEFISEAEQPVFGYGVQLSDEGWISEPNSAIIKKLSQEHGIVSVTPEILSEYEVGDFMGFLPVHSCLTADLMGSYTDLNGQTHDHLSSHAPKQ
jgi:D-serine deaminase-like pyridoxal phosphate-dependent protein